MWHCHSHRSGFGGGGKCGEDREVRRDSVLGLRGLGVVYVGDNGDRGEKGLTGMERREGL